MRPCSIVQRCSHWIVALRDQGPCIAPELRTQLFAPLQRLRDCSHPAVGGVGLALVHTVVQWQCGTLEVGSNVGRGATCSAYIRSTHPPG